MNVTLVDVSRNMVTATVIRFTATRVHVQTADGLIHVCSRTTGKPHGPRGAYSITKESLALLEDGGESFAPKSKVGRKAAGFPSNWNV